MKFRLSVSSENYEAIKEYLLEHHIDIDDEAELVITETSSNSHFVTAHDEISGLIHLSTDDIVFIEAFGKEILIHTINATCTARDRIYQLEELLNPDEFLRVSKSVIIAKKHVKKIRSTLSMKYVLTMSDGTLIDVTRSYYANFRSFFQI